MSSNKKEGRKGQFRQEYYITIDCTKKICMPLIKRNAKAKELYLYLLSVDNKEVICDTITRKELLFEIDLKDCSLRGIKDGTNKTPK